MVTRSWSKMLSVKGPRCARLLFDSPAVLSPGRLVANVVECTWHQQQFRAAPESEQRARAAKDGWRGAIYIRNHMPASTVGTLRQQVALRSRPISSAYPSEGTWARAAPGCQEMTEA